jgi:hypothetical protein
LWDYRNKGKCGRNFNFSKSKKSKGLKPQNKVWEELGIE